MAKKYKNRPLVVSAVQWTGWNISECKKFCMKLKATPRDPGHDNAVWIVEIPTPVGDMEVYINFWIVKVDTDEYFVCEPEAFEKAYEAA